MTNGEWEYGSVGGLTEKLRKLLRGGTVIPAHPLALTAERKLDEQHQAALTRYYCAAGAGGIAVGVHTTQFEIREPRYGLLEPVLALASETAVAALQDNPRPFIKVAGLCGDTRQALREAELALSLGYHAGLLSLAAFKDAADADLLVHCRHVAEVMPVFGFYLQPAVGGRVLSYTFWRQFTEIPNVVAIKIAPFNRYQTLDVVRAVSDAGRASDIALYTGNDDNIIADLLTEFDVGTGEPVRIVGGLLGQRAVWTHTAVRMLHDIQSQRATGTLDAAAWLRLGAQLTDANAAIFDAAHGFRGCIPGIHEILRHQGLMRGRWCLDPALDISSGQQAEIERVYRSYPHLNDDAFVREHLDGWLR
ncbi:MAG: dihydrodipicolinate synthase family protein [Anaerolineae bacterium]|nr:dihydrodipicolinate synthase family protein [Anaerolineae bacterium]